MRGLAALRRTLIAAGAIALALAAWLLAPGASPEDAREPALRVVVVDASASVVRRRPSWLPWARARIADEARDALASGEDAALIVFANGAEVRVPPGPADALLAALAGTADRAPLEPALRADGASDLTSALEVALVLVVDPARPPGTVVLLGDATSTGRDPTGALGRLRAAGVETRCVPPPRAELGDAGIVAFTAPERVEFGAPLVARATLMLAPPLGDEVLLAVELSGASGLRTELRTVKVPPGGGRVVAPIELGPADVGRTEMRARVVAPGGDPIPENDRASAATVARGQLVVGAAVRDSAREDLVAWLGSGAASRLPGMQVLPFRPDELPGVIDDLDCLVTFDVSLDELPAELVASFVDRGGGWLAISGFGFLNDWSPSESAREDGGLHALLPLEPAPIDGGPRDVVLMVDGSGSMAGEPFDLVRAAAVDMVGAALPRDEIQLRFFTAGLERPRLLRQRGTRSDAGTAQDRARTREEAARALFSARVPGGSTWILACLDQLCDEREKAGREALVLLLTDGREAGEQPDPVAKAAGLVERFRAARTSLRVIAVGRDADLLFLSRLVAPGEELVRAAELGDLAEIFQREIHRGRVDGPPAMEVRRVADGGPLAGELESTRADEAAPPPPLERLVRDKARPGATTLLATDEGRPVLAAWRVGLGRTAVFASAPRAGWGDAWASRPELLGDLLRWLGRGERERGPRAFVERGDGEPRLVVEGLPGDAPPRLVGKVVAPGGDGAGTIEPGQVELGRVELLLAPRPGAELSRDRRTGRAPRELARSAGRHATLVLSFGDETLGLALAVPPPAEFLPAEADLAAWSAPADPGGEEAGRGDPAGQSATLALADEPAGLTAGGPLLLAAGLLLVFAGAALGRLARGVQAPAGLRR